MNNSNKKVFVGMSGGVDSSVAAGILKKEGYEVTGVYLTCFDEGKACTTTKDRLDAERVAAVLDIPFEVWDLRAEYKRAVFDYMVDGYERGLTPNPDVMCNKEIKFGVFLKMSLGRGADYVATGHYAYLGQENGNFILESARDLTKDQSYWLWTLTRDQLEKVLFPLGRYLKSEVREMAREMKLPTAEKKDSQGLCFVGKVNFQEFLGEVLPKKEGVIRTVEGEEIGKHRGVYYYTVGQRHNIGVTGGRGIYYVIAKDQKKNELIVAERGSESSFSRELILSNLNLIRGDLFKGGEDGGVEVMVRIRYRQSLQPAILKLEEEGLRGRIIFKEGVEFAAEGQSAVFYSVDGKELFGGGVIKERL